MDSDLVAVGDPLINGLPGVPGRVVATLAKGLATKTGTAAIVGDLLDAPDDELLTLPGIGTKTLKTAREGLLAALLTEDRRTVQGEQVTWEELGDKRTTPLQGNLTDISNPCQDGRHYRCQGKIALAQKRHGKRYVRCKCPYCNHPKIRTMPLKK